MGIEKGLTHCKEEMSELKSIVMNETFKQGSGKYEKVEDFNKVYIDELSKNKIKKKLKVVAACGNGTAGIFAPEILRNIGCEVIELDCNLDYSFPRYNPNPEDMEKACTLAVRGLDALLTYQNYPIIAAQMATEGRRPLGVGIINLAYFLAKNDTSYSDPDALKIIDTWAQHWSYYLIKASADLAEEFGACPMNDETKYS